MFHIGGASLPPPPPLLIRGSTVLWTTAMHDTVFTPPPAWSRYSVYTSPCLVGETVRENLTCSVPTSSGCQDLWSYDYGYAFMITPPRARLYRWRYRIDHSPAPRCREVKRWGTAQNVSIEHGGGGGGGRRGQGTY